MSSSAPVVDYTPTATVVPTLASPGGATAPVTLETLAAQMDRLTRAMESIAGFASRAPAAVAMMTDIADDTYRAAAAGGVDLDERFHLALQLAERLTAPRTVQVLSALLDRIDDLERLLAAADRLPGSVAMAVDIADDVMRETQAAGLDVERGLINGAGAAIRFGAIMGPEQVASLEAVFKSGVLDPAAVEVIGGIGGALASASAEPTRPAGAVGVLRALRDPDVKRALGLLIRFATAFGQQLDQRRPAPTT